MKREGQRRVSCMEHERKRKKKGAYVNDSGQSIDNVDFVLNLVTWDIVGDVGEKLAKVCDFEDLVCGDELESLHTIWLQ
jgi:hypothetical protein